MKVEMNVIEIEWEGPISVNDTIKLINDNDYGIYQIYGTHPVFGSNTLLYIGKASLQTFATRLFQHNWIEWSPSDVSIYIGRLGSIEDITIEEWEKQIDIAERLLIYYCKPPHNSSNINYFGKIENTIVLNYGKRHSIPFEVSTLWETSDYVVNYDGWNAFTC